MAEPRGLAAHRARLERLAGPALRAATGAAIQRGAQALAEAARDAAGDGRLADGIDAVATGPQAAEVRSTAPHAAAIEYGSARSPGRPYLRPAAARLRGAIVAAVARAVRAAGRGG